MYVFIVESRGGDPPSSLWENSSKRILMVEKIISSVVFIVWGEEGGIRGGEEGVGGIMLNSAESIPQTLQLSCSSRAEMPSC